MAIRRAGRAGALYEAIGRELKDLREKQGVRQEELAARIALSRSSIANAEAGRQAIPLHHLVEIAEALGGSASAVLQAAERRQVRAAPIRQDHLPRSVVAFLAETARAAR